MMPLDVETAAAMSLLFERGRVALYTYVAGLPEDAQPLGGPRAVARMDVVRLDDFLANAALCFRHVVRNRVLTHVLCDEGHLCAIVEPRVIKRW